jgi:hypothetical protein
MAIGCFGVFQGRANVNRPSCRLSIAVALVGLATTSLPGCSSSNSPSATTTLAPTSAATTTTTAAADCTEAGLADAATKAVQAVSADNTYRINTVKCADGWAVTTGLWSGKANPDMGAPSTLVFQQQGTQWVGQDKHKVCGTNASTTPAPADATIPTALYELGCLTG